MSMFMPLPGMDGCLPDDDRFPEADRLETDFNVVKVARLDYSHSNGE
ncbi:MAG: hypothetical protein RJQ21_07745 [Rhodospirillales bacterium]